MAQAAATHVQLARGGRVAGKFECLRLQQGPLERGVTFGRRQRQFAALLRSIAGRENGAHHRARCVPRSILVVEVAEHVLDSLSRALR